MKFRRFKTTHDSIFLSDLVSAADITANLLFASGLDELSQDATFIKNEFRPKISEMVEAEYRGELKYFITEKHPEGRGFVLNIEFKTYDGKREEYAQIIYSVL